MSFGGAVRIDFAATAKCEVRTSFASPQVTKDSSTIEAEIVKECTVHLSRSVPNRQSEPYEYDE